MVPAPRAEPGPTPDELLKLKRLYDALPPFNIRYKTEPGYEFLAALDEARATYTPREIAHALQVTTQAVYSMLRHLQLQVKTKPQAWPTTKDLRALRTAWRVVLANEGRQHAIARDSDTYQAVHAALSMLLPRFELGVIARAMGERTRRLERYVEPPMPSPDELVEVVRRRLRE